MLLYPVAEHVLSTCTTSSIICGMAKTCREQGELRLLPRLLLPLFRLLLLLQGTATEKREAGGVHAIAATAQNGVRERRSAP